jgi:hypothetical protein
MLSRDERARGRFEVGEGALEVGQLFTERHVRPPAAAVDEEQPARVIALGGGAQHADRWGDADAGGDQEAASAVAVVVDPFAMGALDEHF